MLPTFVPESPVQSQEGTNQNFYFCLLFTENIFPVYPIYECNSYHFGPQILELFQFCEISNRDLPAMTFSFIPASLRKLKKN